MGKIGFLRYTVVSKGGGFVFLGSKFFVVFLASYGLLTCIGVGENATYHLERPIRVPNPSLL